MGYCDPWVKIKKAYVTREELWLNKTIHILYVSLCDSIKAHVQNGDSGSYMDAVFKLMAHKESDLDMSITVLPREAYYSSQVGRACIAFISRDTSAISGQRDQAIQM